LRLPLQSLAAVQRKCKSGHCSSADRLFVEAPCHPILVDISASSISRLCIVAFVQLGDMQLGGGTLLTWLMTPFRQHAKGGLVPDHLLAGPVIGWLPSASGCLFTSLARFELTCMPKLPVKVGRLEWRRFSPGVTAYGGLGRPLSEPSPGSTEGLAPLICRRQL
jgi:hypothetical protein